MVFGFPPRGVHVEEKLLKREDIIIFHQNGQLTKTILMEKVILLVKVMEVVVAKLLQ